MGKAVNKMVNLREIPLNADYETSPSFTYTIIYEERHLSTIQADWQYPFPNGLIDTEHDLE